MQQLAQLAAICAVSHGALIRWPRAPAQSANAFFPSRRLVRKREQALAADQAQIARHGTNRRQANVANRQPRNIREWRAAQTAIGGKNAVKKRRGRAPHKRNGRSFRCRRQTAISAVATAEDRPPHPPEKQVFTDEYIIGCASLVEAAPAMLPFAASTFRPQDD